MRMAVKGIGNSYLYSVQNDYISDSKTKDTDFPDFINKWIYPNTNIVVKANNKNINFKSKTILTKVKNQPKIDMFCKSNEVKSALMEKFISLRDSFSEKLYPILKKYSIFVE